MITHILQTIIIGDQQRISGISTLYECQCMVRICIAIQEGAAVVVSIKGFPAVIAVAAANLIAIATLYSIAQHLLWHLHPLHTYDNHHGWFGVTLYSGEALSL